MMDEQLIRDALQPPEGWEDTPEQAQMRACLIAALSGHEPVDTTRIALELITVLRDQLLSGLGVIRRSSAKIARSEMSPDDLAKKLGHTGPTISRLLTEARSKH